MVSSNENITPNTHIQLQYSPLYVVAFVQNKSDRNNRLILKYGDEKSKIFSMSNIKEHKFSTINIIHYFGHLEKKSVMRVCFLVCSSILQIYFSYL